MNQTQIAVSRRPTRAGVVQLLTSAGLPASDLTDRHMEDFLHAGPADMPDGLVGVELYGEHALLRSLVVSPSLRRHGLGRVLVAKAEEYAREHGASRIYLLTTTAERFFGALGYVVTAREAAPAAIAYFTPCRSPVSQHADHRFHAMPVGHFT